MQAAAAPRKVAALGLLLAVLLIVAGVQLIGRGQPAGASAASALPVLVPVSTTPQPAGDVSVLSGGTAAMKPIPLPPLPAELARDIFAPPDSVGVSMASVVIDSPAQTNPSALSDDTTFTPDSAVLQATYESSGPEPLRLAIIGGREVRIGDRLGAWRVSSIRPRQVTLMSGERSVTLLMP
jgi:hypothetical protein